MKSMKIYVIPYTFKTYLDCGKIHSGIDLSMIKTIDQMMYLGHEIRLFAVSANIGSKYSMYTYTSQKEDLKNIVKTNRKDIYACLLADIRNFNPDLIFTMHEMGTFYRDLCNLNIPIIYQSHAVPGFFADLNNGNLIHKLSNEHLFIACVSQYHKKKYENYYKKGRSIWDFPYIHVDGILPSIYIKDRFKVENSDGTVRHISALHPEKKTFYTHQCLEASGIRSEVFTTSSYLSSNNSKISDYASNNVDKYKDITFFDAKRDLILSSLLKSMCTFVGLASYDTYTITSLESLSMGVPLIVFGDKNYQHPALEMCDEVMKDRFVSVVRNKQEFLAAVSKYQSYTLTDRQELAERAYQQNSDVSFKEKLDKLLSAAVIKYNNNKPQTLETFWT